MEQKTADLHAKMQAANAEQKATIEKRISEVKADYAIGSAKLEQSLQHVKSSLHR
jgi:hypothetical protein